MDDEPELIERWAVCTTDGCGNQDVPMHVYTVDGARVRCGVCGQQITEVYDQAPGDDKELPQWISEMLQTEN